MNRTALITGSTAGIGKATALALAKMGWAVIVHGKEEAKCQDTVKELMQLSNNTDIHYCCSDLADLKAVKQMADEIIHSYPYLNVLINNAGTFSHERKLTNSNLEMTWVVNYLSRFTLTNSLLDTLKLNAPSRIVDVSGAYHAKGQINFEDISLEHNYSMARANNQSKLANVLFTYHLSRILEGTNVTINTLHPGAVNTGSVLKSEGFSPFLKWIYRLMIPFFKHLNRELKLLYSWPDRIRLRV